MGPRRTAKKLAAHSFDDEPEVGPDDHLGLTYDFGKDGALAARVFDALQRQLLRGAHRLVNQPTAETASLIIEPCSTSQQSSRPRGRIDVVMQYDSRPCHRVWVVDVKFKQVADEQAIRDVVNAGRAGRFPRAVR